MVDAAPPPPAPDTSSGVPQDTAPEFVIVWVLIALCVTVIILSVLWAAF